MPHTYDPDELRPLPPPPPHSPTPTGPHAEAPSAHGHTNDPARPVTALSFAFPLVGSIEADIDHDHEAADLVRARRTRQAG